MEVNFCCVSFHVDILVNEKADKASNEAATSETEIIRSYFSLGSRECILATCWHDCRREDTRTAKHQTVKNLVVFFNYALLVKKFIFDYVLCNYEIV